MDTSKRTKKSRKDIDKNPKRLIQSRESEMYQTVGIACCQLRGVFVMAPNPTRNWTQSMGYSKHKFPLFNK